MNGRVPDLVLKAQRHDRSAELAHRPGDLRHNDPAAQRLGRPVGEGFLRRGYREGVHEQGFSSPVRKVHVQQGEINLTATWPFRMSASSRFVLWQQGGKQGTPTPGTANEASKVRRRTPRVGLRGCGTAFSSVVAHILAKRTQTDEALGPGWANGAGQDAVGTATRRCPSKPEKQSRAAVRDRLDQ